MTFGWFGCSFCLVSLIRNGRRFLSLYGGVFGVRLTHMENKFRNPFRKGWPQSTRSSSDPETLKMFYHLDGLLFFKSLSVVLVMIICGVQKARHFFFLSCCFFLFQLYPELHNLDFGVYSNRWFWKSGLFWAWQGLSENCWSCYWAFVTGRE